MSSLSNEERSDCTVPDSVVMASQNVSFRFISTLVRVLAAFGLVVASSALLREVGLIRDLTREIIDLGAFVFLAVSVIAATPATLAGTLRPYLAFFAACLIISGALDLASEVHLLDAWPVLGDRSPLNGFLRQLLSTAATCTGVMIVYRFVERSDRDRLEELSRANDLLRTQVTAHERVQKALQLSEERFRTLVERAPDGILVYDPVARRIVEANSSAEQILRRHRQELLATCWLDISAPFQRDGQPAEECGRQLEEHALLGRPQATEWLFLTTENEPVLTELRLSRLPSVHHDLIRASLVDISERRRLLEQLVQSQKMEAVGQLAAGIAHDFNNLLTVILGSTALAQEAIEEAAAEDSPVLEDLAIVEDAARQAAGLTRQLLTFSRQQVISPSVLDLNEVLEGLQRMIRRLIREDIDLRITLGDDLWPIRADGNQLEQIVLNLVANANDAMPNGGQLAIATANVLLKEEHVRAFCDARAGNYVLLLVSDTGSGMDKQTCERVFEPFFTTKPTGKGTGMGLATVHGIVRQFGGLIQVHSEPDVGTVFEIHFPAAVSLSSVPREGEAGEDSDSGPETILLCGDDHHVWRLALRTLESRGYAVLSARSASDALNVALAHGTPIDLLITDLRMSEMDGPQLAKKLRQDQPHMQALYVTGAAPAPVGLTGLPADRSLRMLEKPFSPESLAQHVREALDQRSSWR